MARSVLVSSRFDADNLAMLRAAFPELAFFHLPPDGSVPPGGAEAEVIFRCGMPKPALQKALADARGVRWVHSCTAGFEWMMVPEIDERGIVLTRSSATLALPIGEFVVGYIFLMTKRFPDLLRAQAERRWMSHEPPAQDVIGKTVGIVGAGAIGVEVAWRCAALGMRVIGMKRSPAPVAHFEKVLGPDGLGEILGESDFVVLSSPLTDQTRGMIGAPQLRQMKPTAHLLNIARGGLTVEADLVRALAEGWIAGACLDVFDQEPLPPESPLWALPNVVLTPHFSYSSANSLIRAVEEFKQNLSRYLRGEPLANTYDAGRGY